MKMPLLFIKAQNFWNVTKKRTLLFLPCRQKFIQIMILKGCKERRSSIFLWILSLS